MIAPLTICLSHGWGGLEQIVGKDHVLHIKNGIAARLVVLNGSPLHHFLKDQNLETSCAVLDHTPRNFLDFRFMRFLRKQIRSGRNILHCHQPSLLSTIVPALIGFKNVALVVSRHIGNNHQKKGIYYRWLYGRVDRYIVMSEALREIVMNTHAIHPKKIKVIRYGLDLEWFDPKKWSKELIRKKIGISEAAIVVGLFGRLDPAKGQETLLRALDHMNRTFLSLPRVHVLLVGDPTAGLERSFLEHLKTIVRGLGLSDQVFFVGFQNNIPEYMNACDVIVMPSAQEAFGMVAIEALAMEKALIASMGGSILEITQSGECGWLIPPGDPIALADQITKLIQEPTVRQMLGVKGRGYVSEHYAISNRTQETLGLYRQLFPRLPLTKGF